MKNKRGQVTIFIIIAVVIIAGFALYLTLKTDTEITSIPSSIEPVYTNFLSCIEDYSLVGINILESQGGYINLPDFEPGSSYMPFSSQLDFIGNPIPYWYYVSGNNIQKEQVPTRQEIEEQLENYVEERIRDCNFDSYYEEDFKISLGDPIAKVDVQENKVITSLEMHIGVGINDEAFVLKDHKVEVASNLGSLYDSAIEIYEKQQKELFLEEYGLDVLWLYAPVDGVELTCSPQIWNAEEIFTDLRQAIEANTGALKTTGRNDDYFKIDLNIPHETRFLASSNWPYSFEVNPSEDVALVASPVGNQPGLGIIGFCYAPYHFVYDMKYPTLVQVYEGDEIFQFPMAVIIQGNQPREALEGEAVQLEVPELCTYKNTETKVEVYDASLRNVDASVYYECLGTRCYIGDTVEGSLEANFPQCANGYVSASATGYEEGRTLHSTIDSGEVGVVLYPTYEIEVNLLLENTVYNKKAMITFASDNNIKTISYPDQKKVSLREGSYEIEVQIYQDSSLTLESLTTEKCVEVPKTGIGSLLGLKEEKCFDIEFPEQIISTALAGGGNQYYYISESELISSNKLIINSESLPKPTTVEQLQNNYILFEDKGLEIQFT